MGLGDTLLCVIFHIYVQIKNMKNKDERMKIMNEILNGIKVSDR